MQQYKKLIKKRCKLRIILTFAPDKQNISLTKQLSNEQSALGATD